MVPEQVIAGNHLIVELELLNIFLGRKKGATDRIGAPFVVVITISKIMIVFAFVKGYIFLSHL